MTLEESLDYLNFWINKVTGAWYSPDELCEVAHAGQLAFYSDIKSKYSTSQLIKDILSPFKGVYSFTPSNTVSGYIVVPSNVKYLDLLDIQIEYNISNRTVYYGVPVINEDERSAALNSQIDPVTATSPVAEVISPRIIRMYPTTTGYTGSLTYLKQPTKPVFAYTVISGRVIVFDEANSTNLEWRETEIIPVLTKALNHLGINLPDNAVAQFAQAKTESNFSGINRF